MPHRLERAELIALVERIVSVDGTEEEIQEMLNVIRRSVPHPTVSDLIFHSTPALSPTQVVDQALAYQPIILPASLSEWDGDS